VRRIVVITLSIILALVVALPMAFGQTASAAQEPSSPQGDLARLTAEWWNWAFATTKGPGPMEGSYTGGTQCEGEYVDGVFFLAGAASNPDVPSVERTCTVPADTPILFPVVNVICSAAWPTDPQPYDECAKYYTNRTIDPPSTWYSTLDGQDLESRRIASGLFQWTIASNKNPFGLKKGTFEAGSDGLWVYLEEGLTAGEHEIVFGGTFADTPFNPPDVPSFEGTKVTYHLTVE
jgi:hypothetical protein